MGKNDKKGGSKPASQATRQKQAASLKKEVNAAVGGKLGKQESKFIKDLITKASKTGTKGISAAEKEVILKQARIQAKDKNQIVARNNTKNIYRFLEYEKEKIKKEKEKAKEAQATTTTTTTSFSNIATFNNSPITVATSTSAVQTPGRDVVDLATPGVSAETIIGVLFENLAVNELVQFARYDTVEGQDPRYTIISNLSNIKQKYRPSDLISGQTPDASYFSQFVIDLDSKIPSLEFLQSRSDVSFANQSNYVWIDELTGDLVIELINTTSDQLVELEIDTNGTIYEVEVI
jgi:hypothetical protein